MTTLRFDSLEQLADQTGNDMTAAGRALITIAHLLGADGCDLNNQQIYGLAAAVHVIGASIRESGYDLCGKVEEVTKP